MLNQEKQIKERKNISIPAYYNNMIMSTYNRVFLYYTYSALATNSIYCSFQTHYIMAFAANNNCFYKKVRTFNIYVMLITKNILQFIKNVVQSYNQQELFDKVRILVYIVEKHSAQ